MAKTKSEQLNLIEEIEHPRGSYPIPRFKGREQVIVDYAMMLDTYDCVKDSADRGVAVMFPVVAADSILRSMRMYIGYLRNELGLPHFAHDVVTTETSPCPTSSSPTGVSE